MKYDEIMAAMLEHLDANFSAENLLLLVRCCAFGIAHASASLRTHEIRRETLLNLFQSIEAESHAEFLRRHYTPGRAND